MRRLWIVVLAALVALPALAQQQYGSIAGTVVDDQSQPLPGVTVTLTGPYLQGSRTQVTDQAGRFRFMPLPPGSDYAIKYELSGFNTLEQSGIVVNVGKETAVEAQMSLSQFAETITVTAEKIVVDTTKSTVEYAVDWKLLNSMATNRNFQTLMQMAPGVRAGNNPYVHGASNDANIYLIDGVDTTDPRTQTWGTAINWDTIQEAQVQTAGFAAEFGRATGGVVNLVTKSGGNDFSATLRYIWQRADWSAKGGIDEETGTKKPGAGRSDEDRPSLTFGGPIVKDALWFYTAYEKRANHRQYDYYPDLATAVAGGAKSVDQTDYVGRYLSGKLTWQVNPSNSVVGYYNEDPIDLEPLRRGWYESATAHYTPSMDQHQFQGGNNYSLQWYGIMTPNFFLEGKYQYHKQELNVYPMDKSLWGQQPYMRQSTPAAGGNTFFGGAYYDYGSIRQRDGFLFTGSYFLDTAGSSHQFKAGIEYLQLEPTAGRLFNPLGYYILNSAGNPTSRYTWTNQVKENTTKQNYKAIFVQDKWQIGRATINLGVRAESTAIDNNRGSEVLSFGFGKAIAPRLGFAYDLKGDSLHASLGRFYSLASNYIADYFNVVPTNQQYWTWNSAACSYDPNTRPWEYDTSCWRLRYDVNLGASATLDPDLKPQYVDEFSVGYDKLLSDLFAAGINFVWREQPYVIDSYDPEETGVPLLCNFPKDCGSDIGDKYMEYRAVELNLKKRFGPDGFQFLAAYTHVFKADSWLADYRGAVPGTVSSYASNNPLWYGRMEGTDEFKVTGSYTMPWKTTVGITAFWNSGAVYTPTHVDSAGYTIPDARRGSKEAPDQWEADLHVEHPISLGPFDLAVYFDLFNAINRQGVATVNPTTTSANYGKPSTWQAPRRFQAGILIQY